MWRAASVNGLSIFLQFTSSYTIKYRYLIYKALRYCNYYATESRFIKILRVQKKTTLSLKDKNPLKLQSWTKLWSWNYILETFWNNNIYIEYTYMLLRNIYDGVFWRKWLILTIFPKSFLVDIWLGFKYASEKSSAK